MTGAVNSNSRKSGEESWRRPPRGGADPQAKHRRVSFSRHRSGSMSKASTNPSPARAGAKRRARKEKGQLASSLALLEAAGVSIPTNALEQPKPETDLEYA